MILISIKTTYNYQMSNNYMDNGLTKEEAIAEVKEYINKYKYINWKELKSIKFNENNDLYTIIFESQLPEDDKCDYEIQINKNTKHVEKFEMIGYF